MRWLTYIPIRYDEELYKHDAVDNGCIRPIRRRVLRHFFWGDTIIVCKGQSDMMTKHAIGEFDVEYVIIDDSRIFKIMRKKGIASQIIDNGGKLIETEYYSYVSGFIYEAKCTMKRIGKILGELKINDLFIGGVFKQYTESISIDYEYHGQGYAYIKGDQENRRYIPKKGMMEIISPHSIQWSVRDHHLVVPDLDCY